MWWWATTKATRCWATGRWAVKSARSRRRTGQSADISVLDHGEDRRDLLFESCEYSVDGHHAGLFLVNGDGRVGGISHGYICDGHAGLDVLDIGDGRVGAISRGYDGHAGLVLVGDGWLSVFFIRIIMPSRW